MRDTKRLGLISALAEAALVPLPSPPAASWVVQLPLGASKEENGLPAQGSRWGRKANKIAGREMGSRGILQSYL